MSFGESKMGARNTLSGSKFFPCSFRQINEKKKFSTPTLGVGAPSRKILDPPLMIITFHKNHDVQCIDQLPSTTSIQVLATLIAPSLAVAGPAGKGEAKAISYFQIQMLEAIFGSYSPPHGVILLTGLEMSDEVQARVNVPFQMLDISRHE